jgi:hypothetical protein
MIAPHRANRKSPRTQTGLPAPPVQALLEGGTAVRLAAKRPVCASTPRISCRELPGVRPSWLYDDSAQMLFMRPLLELLFVAWYITR